MISENRFQINFHGFHLEASLEYNLCENGPLFWVTASQYLSAERTFIVRGSLHLYFFTQSHMIHSHHHHHGEYDNEGTGLAWH